MDTLVLIFSLILIFTPIGFFVGRRFLKLNQLKMWHLYAATLAATLIGYLSLKLQVVALFPGGLIIFPLLFSCLILLTFHLVLRKFVSEIKINHSLLISLSILFVVSMLVFVSIPFVNSLFY